MVVCLITGTLDLYDICCFLQRLNLELAVQNLIAVLLFLLFSHCPRVPIGILLFCCHGNTVMETATR